VFEAILVDLGGDGTAAAQTATRGGQARLAPIAG
jgi:hypothetical protein